MIHLVVEALKLFVLNSSSINVNLQSNKYSCLSFAGKLSLNIKLFSVKERWVRQDWREKENKLSI